MGRLELIECVENNDSDGILRCLEAGHPIDESEADGKTALLVACTLGNMDIVKFLIEKNANVFEKDCNDMNAVLFAASNNFVDLVEYLIELGVDPNETDKSGRNALHLACEHGCNETVQYFLHKKLIRNLNAKTMDGKDALLLSIDSDCSAASVMELLVQGANVKTHTTDGRNILMESIRVNKPQLFHLFYRYSNIDINQMDQKKNTCMHHACHVGDVNVMKSLLHRGAFARVLNSSGQLPIQIARENGFEDCVKLLERVSSPPSTPVIDSIQKNPQNDMSLIVTWHRVEKENYYPMITAAEFQLKQQKLFDSWKTVDTIQLGKTPFEETVPKSSYSFAEGEATDVEDEEDEAVRAQVEGICSAFADQSSVLEHRIEPNRQENRIQNYYELIGLNPRQVYQIRMRCADKCGWSEFSHGVVFCPKDIDERWDRTEAIPLIKLRASFIQINPSSQQHQVDWNTIDQSNMETQKQIPVMSSVELMEQIITGGVDVLRQKVKEGTDLKTLRKKNGMSVLHVAASTASESALEIVKEIIQNRYIDVNDVNGACTSALHYAVYNNNGPVVSYLLEHGADIMITDSAGMTPFLLAASRGYLQLCGILMDHMTTEQIQAVDKHGRNALVLAISNTHVHVAAYLITKGFSSQFKSPAPREWNLLFFAIATKNEPTVKFCLEQGISPLETCGDGQDAIEFSSESGSKAITKLLEHYSDPADVVESASIQAKRTEAYITVVLPTLKEVHPLFAICRVEVNYKKAALLQSPQSMVMDIDASQKSVRVPLIQLSPATTYRCKIRLANKNGWGEWESGFDFTTLSQDPQPAQNESLSGDYLAVTGMQKINYETRESKTQGNIQVKNAIDANSASSLLQLSASEVSTAVCSCGLPALHYAILLSDGIKGDAETMIDTLLSMGCSISQAVDTLSFSGLTPIDCACMLSSTQILEYLENCGADLLHGEIEGLPACAMYSLLAPNTNVLEYLFRKEYLTSQHISPLLFALAKSRASSEEVFGEFLIQKGADINEMNSDGDGLLHIAVMHNNLAFLAFALSHGAKRDQKNASGLTALSLAQQKNQLLCMQLLMNSYRVPLPASAIQQYTVDASHTLWTWSYSSRLSGIPAADQFEVEIVHLLSNQVLSLPCSLRLNYVFLEAPLPLHRWLQLRVRAHNENGWGEWAESSQSTLAKLPEASESRRDFFVWLACHGLEEAFEFLVQKAVDTPAKFAVMNKKAIEELAIGAETKRRMTSSMQTIVDEVLKGEINPMVRPGCMFMWEQ